MKLLVLLSLSLHSCFSFKHSGKVIELEELELEIYLTLTLKSSNTETLQILPNEEK